ncbi:MAG: pyridoxal phosphate-dependent aminotransferase [Proteobacteria bacterium]|nr:pyridoxal phosphate-dependent aminotransferase [Pseudomonadota bacterium]NOG59120.1 pyridoxal phosphate-dependent aminotransferase [Pseudomonadota bacterium]
MDISLSHRAQSIKPSPTLAVTQRAAELRAEGKDIIGLGAGEPDFDTPEHIKTAAIESLNKGQTKYTAVDGTVDLKNAIIDKFKRENNLEYNSNQVLVSCGAKHSLYNLFQAVLNSGDEIIIPAPYWVSYPDMAKLAGAEPVIIKTTIDDHFKITPNKLRGAISEKTRMVVFNSPSNPTGVSYTEEELAALGEVLIEHPDILIVTDDIYEHILWGQDKFVNIVNACPDLYDRTIVVNGVSKAYSMTGWRIGYVGGPESVIKGMKKIQSQSTSNPTSMAQAGAVAALTGPQTYIEESTVIFKERHDFVLKSLQAIDGITCIASEGTFYSFPDMNGLIEKLDGINNDIELAEFFLEKAEVAMVPGSAFGAPGCMRISFATSMENLEKSMERIKNAVEN